MAYNVGKGTGNFQFTESGKNVLKKIESKISDAIKKATLSVSNDTLERLKNQSGTEQITPRDIYRQYYTGAKASKPRLEDTWTMRPRHSGSSVNFEFRNRLHHASLIYSNQYSVGHDNGFRSAYPHENKPRLYYSGQVLHLEKRPNQLTEVKWKKFISNRKTALTKAINKSIKGINR